MKVKKEGNISELSAARMANKYGLLAEYLYCRRMGYGIRAALAEWDLLPWYSGIFLLDI